MIDPSKKMLKPNSKFITMLFSGICLKVPSKVLMVSQCLLKLFN